VALSLGISVQNLDAARHVVYPSLSGELFGALAFRSLAMLAHACSSPSLQYYYNNSSSGLCCYIGTRCLVTPWPRQLACHGWSASTALRLCEQEAKSKAARQLALIAVFQPSAAISHAVSYVVERLAGNERAFDSVMAWPDVVSGDVLLTPRQCRQLWAELLPSATAQVEQVSSPGCASSCQRMKHLRICLLPVARNPLNDSSAVGEQLQAH
jgi:hypothetical protein